MIDPLQTAIGAASSGLQAQSTRLRITAENLANVHSTGSSPGADPYARKTIQFATELDRASGASSVKIKAIGVDRTPFSTELDPGNPAADAQGRVKISNVNAMVEMADMREAGRSYEANLQMIKQTRSMVMATIDLLRNP